MSYGPQTHNPWEHDETPPDPEGVTCRGCDHFIDYAKVEAKTEDAPKLFNGWWFCVDCYYNMPEVLDGLDRAARADEARDDFNERRR